MGIDAEHPGAALLNERAKDKEYQEQMRKIAPEQKPDGENWRPGSGPSQVLEWAIESLAEAGTLSIIGVYSELMATFPIGKAMNKNLTHSDGQRQSPKIRSETGGVDSGLDLPIPRKF